MEADRTQIPAALRRTLLALLAAVAVLAAARTAQLAWRDGDGLAASPANEAQAEPAALSDQDVALLALACPASLDSMPPALRDAMTRIAPPHRLTAARQPGDGWLVDPDEWFVPEDEPAVPQAPPALPPDDGPGEETDEAAAPAESPVETLVETPVRNAVENPIEPATDADSPATTPPPVETLEDTGAVDLAPAAPAAPPSDLPVVEPPRAVNPTVEVTPPTAELDNDEAGDGEASGPQLIEMPIDVGPIDVGNEDEAPSAPELPAPPTPIADPQPEPIRPPVPSAPTIPAPRAPLFAPPEAQAGPPHAPPVVNQPVGGGLASPATGSPHSTSAKPLSPQQQADADESHRELFARNCYPSARECAKCHKKQYEEWSVSSHAYAFVSPMFQKFEQKISTFSSGTVGYFCQRCHSPIATAMGESRDTPIWEMAEVAREGVTCIACHRVNERYSKSNGERRVVPGDIHAPVYGGIGGDGVAKAIADKSTYKVKTSPDEKGAGQQIHNEGRFFEQLSKAEFCTSCHQVAVHPGIKLEVVWEQYRASPACKKGVTCQHCHMGTVPGVPSPYEIGPIAEVGGKSVNNSRKHANHVFYGPGYSIAHPGVFPFHEKADRWRIDQWLLFDWRAGWGTDKFEDAVDDGTIKVCFPEVWKEVDDRYDAREIIDDNIERLAEKRKLRREVMENGTKVTGPFFKKQPCRGQDMKFEYIVTNINEGHNILTASLGAQPQLWANVVLIGPDGRRLWETGYTDRYGDVADIHSEEVRNGTLPFDSQLFNLQTMFLYTGATGTDREFPLPINISIDQVPQLRPGAQPISVLNHPPFIRMESRSIAPLGHKRVKYKVPGELIQQPGRYRLSFRLRNRTEPIYFMRFCDATIEMQRAMNEGVLDVHPYSVEFEVR